MPAARTASSNMPLPASFAVDVRATEEPSAVMGDGPQGGARVPPSVDDEAARLSSDVARACAPVEACDGPAGGDGVAPPFGGGGSAASGA